MERTGSAASLSKNNTLDVF